MSKVLWSSIYSFLNILYKKSLSYALEAMYNNTTISCWSPDQPIIQCSWMGGWLLITIVGGN